MSNQNTVTPGIGTYFYIKHVGICRVDLDDGDQFIAVCGDDGQIYGVDHAMSRVDHADQDALKREFEQSEHSSIRVIPDGNFVKLG